MINSEIQGKAVRPGFSMEAVEKVVALKGALALNEILRRRYWLI